MLIEGHNYRIRRLARREMGAYFDAMISGDDIAVLKLCVTGDGLDADHFDNVCSEVAEALLAEVERENFRGLGLWVGWHETRLDRLLAAVTKCGPPSANATSSPETTSTASPASSAPTGSAGATSRT